MRTLVATCVLVLALCVTGPGYDLVSGRSVGLGQAVVLSRPSASELVNVPLGGWSDREWRIETGFNRAFDLRDFDQYFVAGGYRRGRFIGGLGFSQFGNSDLYAEQVFKGAIAYHWDSLVVGLTGSGMMIQFGGRYEDLSAMTLGLGGAWRFREAVAAFSIDNLTSPELAAGSLPAKPQYSVLGEYRGKQSYSLVARAVFESAQKPRFSLGQRILLTGSSALHLGISTEPLQYGGGLEIGVSGGVISYTAAYHPVLGLTQTIAVSYGRGHRAETRPDDFE